MVPFLESEDENPEEETEAPQSPKSPKATQASPKSEGKQEQGKEEAPPKKEPPKKVSEELSVLTTFSAVSFKSFEKAKEKKAHEMSSFSENKVNHLLKKDSKGFVDFNSHHVARIYPKGTRFDSSNYDPVPSWNCGAHMVALNHQTGAEPLWINHGKYQDNGIFGYILKPEFLRKPDPNFVPEMKRKAAKTLVLSVLAGYQLPKKAGSEKEEAGKGSVTNPYVVVKISGVGQDKAEQKTKTVKGNGFNPVWNKEMKFALTVPELAHVLIVVMNDVLGRDDFIAQYSLQVSNISQGFHMVPLKDQNCKLYQNACLLVRAQYK